MDKQPSHGRQGTSVERRQALQARSCIQPALSCRELVVRRHAGCTVMSSYAVSDYAAAAGSAAAAAAAASGCGPAGGAAAAAAVGGAAAAAAGR
jgi:hypothetical protein